METSTKPGGFLQVITKMIQEDHIELQKQILEREALKREKDDIEIKWNMVQAKISGINKNMAMAKAYLDELQGNKGSGGASTSTTIPQGTSDSVPTEQTRQIQLGSHPTGCVQIFGPINMEEELKKDSKPYTPEEYAIFLKDLDDTLSSTN